MPRKGRFGRRPLRGVSSAHLILFERSRAPQGPLHAHSPPLATGRFDRLQIKSCPETFPSSCRADRPFLQRRSGGRLIRHRLPPHRGARLPLLCLWHGGRSSVQRRGRYNDPDVSELLLLLAFQDPAGGGAWPARRVHRDHRRVFHPGGRRGTPLPQRPKEESSMSFEWSKDCEKRSA